MAAEIALKALSAVSEVSATILLKIVYLVFANADSKDCCDFGTSIDQLGQAEVTFV